MNKYLVFIILFALIFSVARIVHPEQGEKWYSYAKEFIEYDMKTYLVENGKIDDEYFDYIHSRSEAKNKFNSSTPASKDKIESLLSSSNIDDIRVGIVSIYLSMDMNYSFIESLITILISSKDFFVKRYALFALGKYSSEDLIKYERDIYSHIVKEEDARIVMQEVKLLLKLTPEKSAKVFKKLLGSDSIAIRRHAYAYLYQLGHKYFESVIEDVAKSKNMSKQAFKDIYIKGEQQDSKNKGEGPNKGHIEGKGVRP